jgi:Helix-turn-helix domain
VPVELNEKRSEQGLRRSVQRLRDLIDTTDPAWPDIAAALQEFAASGIGIDETTVPMAIKIGRQRFLESGLKAPAWDQATLTNASESIVYYIRRGELIKIGTTTSPRSRFTDLLPDEILAVEPGARELEQMRHGQFRHLRCLGEHFRDVPELRDHAERVRVLHGDPDPSWPTSANFKRRPLARLLPPPLSVATITARDAEARLGIRRDTVYAWVRRGKLQEVGRDDQGHRLYYREHLLVLRGRLPGDSRRDL